MLDELRALEEKLLRPEIRRNREAASSLIADDFREFGSSGRIFSKADILHLMANESAFDVRLTDFRLTPLAPDAALLNYRAIDSSNGSATLRSSLWVHRDGRWQMLFHQGTLSAL
jgi:hypothetical protein